MLKLPTDQTRDFSRPTSTEPRGGAALRRVAAALSIAAGGTLACLPAMAQTSSYPTYPSAGARTVQAQTLAITAIDVEQVQSLQPGTELAFTVWGTPGAQARLQIDGAQRPLLLEEVSTGVYRGWYAVRSGDRLRPESRVTVNLRSGSRVVSSVLGETLVAAAPTQSMAANGPVIEDFSARRMSSNRGSNALVFTLRGTPGGQAWMRVRGSQDGNRIALSETSTPGVYEGMLALDRGTQIDLNQPVSARLRVGDRTVTANLNPSLDAGLVPAQMQVQGAVCTTCGSVIAIRPVEVRGEGGYVGPIAGGLLGAVLGNQVGGGDGRKVAAVGGAVAGALLGREFERRRGGGEASTHYDVVVRMDNGEERTISVPAVGDLKVGSWVKIDAQNQIAIDNERVRSAPRY